MDDGWDLHDIRTRASSDSERDRCHEIHNSMGLNSYRLTRR
jgi:hypothetical protein